MVAVHHDDAVLYISKLGEVADEFGLGRGCCDSAHENFPINVQRG